MHKFTLQSRSGVFARGQTMKHGRCAINLGLLACLSAAGPALAFDVIESTDFPGGASFSNPSVGVLESGANTVSGALAGNCVVGDCNGTGAGDTQDSFLLTVPAGYQISSLTVTTSAVSGPTNFSASMELRSPTGVVQFTPFLSPLPGTTVNLLTAPVGAGTYSMSIYGQQASAAGAFSLAWSVAMNLVPLVTSPATAVTNLINLILDPLSGLVLTSGQTSSLTDKLNNVLISIQAGQNKQAANQLQAFINSVQAYVKTGKLSAATANTLIVAANAIMTSLQ